MPYGKDGKQKTEDRTSVFGLLTSAFCLLFSMTFIGPNPADWLLLLPWGKDEGFGLRKE